MARPKRIDLPHCLYHVLSRSNTGDIVFRDKYDQEKFLFYLSEYSDAFSFRIHAWCLMDSHFHLLLESSNRQSLSEFMRRLLTAYTVYFNRRHARHGHLFQGRFKSYIVDKKAYLLALSRYIHLNPCRLKRKNDPFEYEGSSMRYYINAGEPDFLHTREILSFFKGNRKKYAKFVKDGLNREIKLEIVNQRYLGDEEFINRLRKRIGYERLWGSRAMKAKRKREHVLEKTDLEKAEKIVKQVAGYFKIDPKIIIRKKGSHGNIGMARTLILALLHKYLPWNYVQLASYLGLKNKAGIDYHLKKVRNNGHYQEIMIQIDSERGYEF